MNSTMDQGLHHALLARAVELGRSTDPGALPELIDLLKCPAATVRKYAASAIGKLAEFGADGTAAVAALRPVAFRDPLAQTQQYAIKALKAYGAAAECCLPDLRDLLRDTGAKDYVRQAALQAGLAIKAAVAEAANKAVRRCQRCHRMVQPDEYTRSQQAFQRTYCDHCFDEVYLQRRNWETNVELQKTIRTADGTLVQSKGEKAIAEWLSARHVTYRYDNRFRIIKGYAIRPDFYLPEYDLYLEYWGLDTLDYKIGMLEKKKLYQQAGKKLVSFYYTEYEKLPELLADRLGRYFRV